MFTTLSKNSSTLYTYEDPNISSKFKNLNFQRMVDETLASINDDGNMFVSTISSTGRTTNNNVVMLCAKDISNDGDVITVASIVEDTLNQTVVFSILNDILIAFREEGANTLLKNTSFKKKMTEIIENPIYWELDEYGSLTQANQEIDQVRTLMNDNIERVLQRGERIHLLVNKTDKLNNASNSFRRRTVAIKRKLWWSNFKFIIILVLCGLILLYFIGGEFCGLPIYQKCLRRDDEK